ncbi:MAG: TetR/AcrR family transcriptional regulator [Pseudomonadota bacterium]
MEAERRYHVGDLRGRLTREARRMLDEGLPLNLRALAARTGITTGSMYHHYQGKAELLAEVAGGGFRELRQALEAADRDAAPGGRLRAWATGYFAFARREPALFALMFDPEIADQTAVAEARKAVLDALRRVVGEVANAQGRAQAPLEQITLAVWAAAHGAAALAMSTPGRPELIDEVIAGLEALFRP